MQNQRGFTLMEVMVALAIASVALVAMMGRLGSSADIQHDLTAHAMALDEAVELLEKDRLQAISGSEKSGTIETRALPITWRLTTEKTLLKKFVKQNVYVSTPGSPDIELSLYRVR
ncbi:MAG: type II secretion system protein [Mariprofundaceae bacterium]